MMQSVDFFLIAQRTDERLHAIERIWPRCCVWQALAIL